MISKLIKCNFWNVNIIPGLYNNSERLLGLNYFVSNLRSFLNVPKTFGSTNKIIYDYFALTKNAYMN